MIQLKTVAFGAALFAFAGGVAFADDAAKTDAPASEAPASEAPAPTTSDTSTMTKNEQAQLKTCKSLPYRTMLRNKMCKAFLAAHPGAIPAPN